MSGHCASSLLRVRRRAAPRAAAARSIAASAARVLVGLAACSMRGGRAQLLRSRAPAWPARARAACSRAPCRRSRPGSARARPARSASGACCGACRTAGSRPSLSGRPELGQARLERLVQRGDAVVVEAAGHRAEHRHLVGPLLEGLAVALHLLGHVAQRVGRALAVELVDRDELGEVEHVDLLELARRAELGRHHVHRHVDQRHDGRVALADARGLDDHQVEAGGLARGDARRAARR